MTMSNDLLVNDEHGTDAVSQLVKLVQVHDEYAPCFNDEQNELLDSAITKFLKIIDTSCDYGLKAVEQVKNTL